MLVKGEIQGVLCELFAAITGVLWIQTNPQPADDLSDNTQDTPRPQGLYGSVNITNFQDTGHDDEVYVNQDLPDEDLVQNIDGHRVVQVSLNTYRVKAMDTMAKLFTALQKNSTLEILNAANLGVVNRSDVRNLTLIVGPGLEERYQMDLFLHAIGSDTDIVAAIQSITITAVGDNGTNKIEYNIEVP